MTITREAPTSPAHGDVEALFPEARRRRRRIRTIFGLVAVAVATSAALLASVGRDGPPPRTTMRAPISSAPNTLAPDTIARKTMAAGTAQQFWRSIDSYPGCNPVRAGAGVVDFATAQAAVTISESGCLPGGGTPDRSNYEVIQIGGSVYQTRQPHELGDFPSGKTWLLTSDDAEPWLATATPLRVLNAVSGPLHRVGTTWIRGEATTEYEGVATLASIQTATSTVNAGPIGTPDPPLTLIPIQVHVWTDAQDRVRQISTWEQLYTQNYTDGYSQGGDYITPWPPHHPAGPPRRQGYDETTLDLWQFGIPVHITRPPSARVTTPH